jgi:hypothetical protein
MSNWDPLLSPGPLDRESLTGVDWFNLSWAAGTMARQLKLRQCLSTDLDPEKPYMCQKCNIGFGNTHRLEDHERLWHSPRDAWECPSLNDINAGIYLQTGPLARYLFPDIHADSNSEEEPCPYCGEPFTHEDTLGSRIEHLKDEHKLGECLPPRNKFIRRDQFVLHLANVHDVRPGEWKADVVEFSRKRLKPLISASDEYKVHPVVVKH